MANSTLIVDYLGYGVEASKPATPATGTGCLALYFATDTGKLWGWSGSWSVMTSLYDIGFYKESTPTASERILLFPFVRSVTFPGNFSGAQAKVATAATASTTFTVKKNGSAIGTIVFAISATTATFTTTAGAAQSFVAGDYLEIIAPASPDATLADVSVVLTGARV